MSLRNAWYVAAIGRELAAKPIRRSLLGEPLGLYRGASGTPTALSDRCAHRYAALSQGRIDGDALECPYHGFTYGPDGRCIRIPGVERIQEGIHVRSFPVVERWGWVFVWMGAPERAAAGALPDFRWNTEPGGVGRDALLPVRASHALLRDNLLDLTHAKFVHQRTLGTEAVTEFPIEATQKGDVVCVRRDMLDIEPSPFFRRVGEFQGNVDHSQSIEFHPPCNVLIHVRVRPSRPGDATPPVEVRVLNALAPETAHSTHYFWNLTRSFALADRSLTDLMYEQNASTFFEDVTIVKAQQINLETAQDWSPIGIPADRGIMLAARLMERLIAAEHAPAHQESAS
ncbi:MAG: aromatic ring-hydroxylating dioxygenase subunit alpha [Burkholderiales bacterium]